MTDATDKKYVLSIDQGTTSSRAILFDHSGTIIAVDQKEHEQIFPRAGWVEHDAMEIWRNVRDVVAGVLSAAEVNRHQIASVGITNQRESAVVWDKKTGEPVYNVIVWQDTRTQRICDRLAGEEGPDKYKDQVGLGLATYFSGRDGGSKPFIGVARRHADVRDDQIGTQLQRGAHQGHEASAGQRVPGARGQAQHGALGALRLLFGWLQRPQDEAGGDDVAVDLDGSAQGCELVDEVVDEGITVIEQDDAHLRPPDSSWCRPGPRTPARRARPRGLSR